MHIDCIDIQNAFSDYLGDKNDKHIKEIESHLCKKLKKQIDVKIIPKGSRGGFFAMAVIPETSVITKVANAIVENESKFSVIKDLWKNCKKWTLEIDSEVFEFLSANELTALTLHEVGHIIQTDAIPKKISNTIQYQIAMGKVSQRVILQKSIFNKLLEIPTTIACQLAVDTDNLKEEIRADKMATINGYLPELTSAISKVKDRLKEDKTPQSSEFIMKAVENLENRESKLIESNFRLIKGGLPKESRLYGTISSLYRSWFEDGNFEFNRSMDTIDRIVQEGYMTEFGLQRPLPAIKQNQLDYIQIKVQSIKTMNDKMMIVSYINGKLEMANYYLAILNNPKQSQRYRIPHTQESLENIKAFLEAIKQEAIDKRIPGIYEINPLYPQGYEG